MRINWNIPLGEINQLQNEMLDMHDCDAWLVYLWHVCNAILDNKGKVGLAEDRLRLVGTHTRESARKSFQVTIWGLPSGSALGKRMYDLTEQQFRHKWMTSDYCRLMIIHWGVFCNQINAYSFPFDLPFYYSQSFMALCNSDW